MKSLEHPPPLDLIQRWFQSVVTHADGAEAGILAPETQQLIALHPKDSESVIRRSSRLSAVDRLSIYAGAYYARLLECMGGCFPVLKLTLGDEIFDSFAFEYLHQYPSRSYTLDHLGEHFCKFLLDTKPSAAEDPGADWPDFLIELATLEWIISRVFDGPGPEDHGTLTIETLQNFPAEKFAEARLQPVAGFELLAFRHAVSSHYTAVRHSGETQIAPKFEACAENVAIFRRDFVVRRFPLTEAQYALLQQLKSGAPVREAIVASARTMDMVDDSFGDLLKSWFEHWSQQGFFASISTPD